MPNNGGQELVDKWGLQVKRHGDRSTVGWVSSQFDSVLFVA
jgi:hypothetical protein